MSKAASLALAVLRYCRQIPEKSFGIVPTRHATNTRDDRRERSLFFFLSPAAYVTTDKPWEYGPEYTFQVQVNSTAIPEEDIYGSMRLNLESKLICQPKNPYALSCHFEDSRASSFIADSLDPSDPAVPTGQVSRQAAYEINEDQFEIRFNDRGLDGLLVNENIQPRELDMIKTIVGQLSVGTALDHDDDDDIGNGDGVTFGAMENFTQGECYATFKIDKKLVGRSSYAKRGFALKPIFGLKDGKLVQIRKNRNLLMCTHKVPYFFGSVESFGEESDIMSDTVRPSSLLVSACLESMRPCHVFARINVRDASNADRQPSGSSSIAIDKIGPI